MIIKISQPVAINKEYYLNEKFLNAYKYFIKTSLEYLNTTIIDTENDINDVIELSKNFAEVKTI